MKIHIKIILILFVIVILLLLGNILFIKNNEQQLENISIEKTLESIDSTFKETLYSLGIDSNWIQIKKTKKPDSVKNYTVKIPNDLPITIVIQELKESFRNDSINVISYEKRINGLSEIIINNNGEFQIFCELFYDKSINRKSSFFSFLISDFEKLNQKKQKEILDIPEHFGIILSPSKENIATGQLIRNSRKEYVLLFDDDINDIQYKISNNYSNSRLLGIIKSVNTHFKTASFLIYDNLASFSNNKSGEYLINRFAQNKISFIPLNYFKLFSEENNSNEINYESNISLNLFNKIIILKSNEYLSILESLREKRKKGDKIILPSEYVSNYYPSQ